MTPALPASANAPAGEGEAAPAVRQRAMTGSDDVR